MTLKKEIGSILDEAEFIGDRRVEYPLYRGRKVQLLQTNMYVTERINEQGYKCIYHFDGDIKGALLRRAASIRKEIPYKFKDSENGIRTQKVILFLKEHKESLQALCDISYLMKSHNYDVQEACRVLFKDKKTLPSCFCLERKSGRSKISTYRFYMDGYYQHTEIEYLLDMLCILPKSYLKGIDSFNG